MKTIDWHIHACMMDCIPTHAPTSRENDTARLGYITLHYARIYISFTRHLDTISFTSQLTLFEHSNTASIDQRPSDRRTMQKQHTGEYRHPESTPPGPTQPASRRRPSHAATSAALVRLCMRGGCSDDLTAITAGHQPGQVRPLPAIACVGAVATDVAPGRIRQSQQGHKARLPYGTRTTLAVLVSLASAGTRTKATRVLQLTSLSFTLIGSAGVHIDGVRRGIHRSAKRCRVGGMLLLLPHRMWREGQRT